MESIQQAAERLTRNIGTLENVYEYRNPDGALAFSNLRIMQSNGSKTFRMMSEVDGAFVLGRAEKPERGWPLYGLLAVNANPDAPVFVVEGEKDVETLLSLDLVAVTSGSTSTAGHADWSPLADRDVILWPDNDNAGRKYMDEVADLLEPIGCSVEYVQVDALGLTEKGDCSDWLALYPSAGADEVLEVARVKKRASEASYALPSAVIVRGDAINIVPVDWLWEGWLAAGKLHLIGGQPGTGKTTIALDLAATVTAGGRWPEGTRAQPGSVVIWSGEDGAEDTLAPRLVAAGADMSRVHLVTGVRDESNNIYPFDPARDMERLDRSIQAIDGLRLIVIDPIVSAVSGDSHKNAEVRRGLQPLVELAKANRCAVIGITHFSKGSGGREPVERITGSLAFAALARVILVTAKRQAEPGRAESRFLARAKSNIGPDGGGFDYDVKLKELSTNSSIVASVIRWGEALEGTARELLAEAETQGDDEARDEVSLLQEILADGPLPVKEVKRQVEDSGLSWRTTQRKRKSASVEFKRGGGGQPGTWKLSSRATSTTAAPHNLLARVGATDETASSVHGEQ